MLLSCKGEKNGIGGQTNRQTDRQADRQTGRQKRQVKVQRENKYT